MCAKRMEGAPPADIVKVQAVLLDDGRLRFVVWMAKGLGRGLSAGELSRAQLGLKVFSRAVCAAFVRQWSAGTGSRFDVGAAEFDFHEVLPRHRKMDG